jgi:hypothetical protein
MATKIENAFERILNRLEDSDEGVQSKTAAAVEEPSTEARMLETVRRVSTATATKTASAAAPAADLQRMAKHAQALEEQAMVKEAHFMGAAIADGFMERFAQYDVALNNAGVKTASADPTLVKAAAEQGYRMAVADMEKTAAAEYNRGYEDTLRGVHKLASEIHYGGQSMARDVLVGLGQKTANTADALKTMGLHALGGATTGAVGGALGGGEGHRMQGALRGAALGGLLGVGTGAMDATLSSMKNRPTGISAAETNEAMRRAEILENVQNSLRGVANPALASSGGYLVGSGAGEQG